MGDIPPLIAIVDDEVRVCRAMERLLRSAGFDVVTFNEGAEFLNFVESKQVDCAILDLHMPQMSGHDVQLRLGLTGRQVPVVIVTGQDSPESQQRAMTAGAVAYLRKPMDDTVLVAAVLRGIGQGRS